jgi:hypothetical protein
MLLYKIVKIQLQKVVKCRESDNICDLLQTGSLGFQ